MTAQIGDIYRYGKKKYQIVAISAGMPFNPKHYGLEPHPSSTACYRGYWCEYSVDDEKLVLKNMYMFNMDDNYPPLNGIEVAPQEYEECWGSKPGMKGIQKITYHIPSAFEKPVELLERYDFTQDPGQDMVMTLVRKG